MGLVCRLKFQTQNLTVSWGYQISRLWCQTNMALNGILQRKCKVRSTPKYPGLYSNEFVFANTIDQSLLTVTMAGAAITTRIGLSIQT